MNTTSTTKQQSEHIVAVIDSAGHAQGTVDVARRTVERGGRATLVLMLTPHDRRAIQTLAEASRRSVGDAEAIFVDRAQEAYRDQIGGSETTTIVRYRPSSAKEILSVAARCGATAVAVPRSLAGHRRWRSTLGQAPVPVVITPQRAA